MCVREGFAAPASVRCYQHNKTTNNLFLVVVSILDVIYHNLKDQYFYVVYGGGIRVAPQYQLLGNVCRPNMLVHI